MRTAKSRFVRFAGGLLLALAVALCAQPCVAPAWADEIEAQGEADALGVEALGAPAAQEGLIDISGAVVSVPDQHYQGSELSPLPTVTLGSTTLYMWSDYNIVSYKNNRNVGTATVTIEGKGKYTGRTSGTFEILPVSLSDAMISVSDEQYTGSGVEPYVSVRVYVDSIARIVSSSEYTTTYSNNVNVGTARLTITGKGGYVGSASTTFKITPRDISACYPHIIERQQYTGSAVKPVPSFYGSYGNPVLNKDYTISYKNNVKPGTASFTVTGRGNYTGSASGTFQIVDESIPIYRLYNRKTSEHLYTSNAGEYSALPRVTRGDWIQEGIAWYAPRTSSTPVYRLYNKKSGDHHYTTSRDEMYVLTTYYGWMWENVAFYSDDQQRLPLYRVYNHRLKRGQHHYTASVQERDALTRKHGWKGEGIGFYGVRAK